MMRRSRQCERGQSGLSLLELLVALTIMAISIGVLYRVLGANVRNVGLLQEQQRAVAIAQSLLDAKDAIPAEGWGEVGESAGFRWVARTEPYIDGRSTMHPELPRLHSVYVSVHWGRGDQSRSLEFQTLRPQKRHVLASGVSP